MKLFKGLLFAAVLLIGFSASAQTVSNRDENGNYIYGPYMINKAGDNWFIGVAGGINALSDKTNAYTRRVAPAIDAYFGKWFTPALGLRLGYQGLKSSMNDTYYKSVEDMSFAYIHGDVMLNLSHIFCGYRSDRFWNFVPYANLGFLHMYNVNDSKDGTYRNKVNKFDNEFAAGAGLLNIIHISNRFNITLDARTFFFSARYHNYWNGGPVNAITVTAGALVNLGKKVTWDRAPKDLSSDLAAANSALAAANAALAAANADIDDLRAQLAQKKVQVDTVYVGKPMDEFTLFFEIGSATLKPTELKHLEYYINNMKEDEKCVFYLTGSADKGTGTTKINQKLGKARVETLTKILTEKYGISADRIVFKEARISEDNPKTPTLDRSVKVTR